jgi:hypothetical protein
MSEQLFNIPYFNGGLSPDFRDGSLIRIWFICEDNGSHGPTDCRVEAGRSGCKEHGQLSVQFIPLADDVQPQNLHRLTKLEVIGHFG